MFTCKQCGNFYHWRHSCPGFVVVREPDQRKCGLCGLTLITGVPHRDCFPSNQEPVFGDIPSQLRHDVRKLREEVAQLLAEVRALRHQGDRAVLAAHWAEHD